MFTQTYPITTTDGIQHIFIDVMLRDYFEHMSYELVDEHRDYHYDSTPTYVTADDGRFCIFIDKRNGNTSGWINYAGNYVEKYLMSLVLKNSIRPLFKDEDEFTTFASFIEPSIKLAFRENGYSEDTNDMEILNTVIIQHIPITITSLNPFEYSLNAFYVKGVRPDGVNIYDWYDSIDRIPIRVHDLQQTDCKRIYN